MNKNIKKLIKKPFFTIKEAEKQGISRSMLSYYVANGEMERVTRGIYRSSHYEASEKKLQWKDLAVAVNNIQGGVICLVSALAYYDMTDELMKEFWIAVDNNHSKVKFPLCRIIKMKDMTMGLKTIKMAGLKVKIFDRERTIIDSFRFFDLDTAVEVLKKYLTGKDLPSLNKLRKYARELPHSTVKTDIMVLIT